MTDVCLVPLNWFSIAVSVRVAVASNLETLHTSVLISVSLGCLVDSAWVRQEAKEEAVTRYQLE